MPRPSVRELSRKPVLRLRRSLDLLFSRTLRPAFRHVRDDLDRWIERRHGVDTFGKQLVMDEFVAVAQARRNAEARAAFISEYQQLSSQEISSRVGPTDPGGQPIVEVWRRRGDIFAVELDASVVYPAFQFAEGRPRPELRTTVHAFRAHGASDWELALWFASPNPWLGAKPTEVLNERPDEVASAARRAFEVPV